MEVPFYISALKDDHIESILLISLAQSICDVICQCNHHHCNQHHYHQKTITMIMMMIIVFAIICCRILEGKGGGEVSASRNKQQQGEPASSSHHHLHRCHHQYYDSWPTSKWTQDIQVKQTTNKHKPCSWQNSTSDWKTCDHLWFKDILVVGS